MSQHLENKGPSERSSMVKARKEKNMDPIQVNPELNRAYQLHEQATRDHIRIHRDANLARRSRILREAQGGKGGA
jgi:hypothetical protein